MLAVLRQRNVGLLWLGGLVSNVGSTMLVIALPFYVYNQTGSALATGAMFIVESIPSILFGSVAGVMVDRWDRQRVMIVSDILRAVLLLLLLALRSPDWLWVVYLVTFVQSTIGQFFGPAKNALIPRLVDSKGLVAANSLFSLSTEVTRLVGPPLGGMTLALLGIVGVVLIDSASLLFSSAMIALIVVPHLAVPTEKPKTVAKGTVESIWRELTDGLRLARRESVVFGLLMVMAIFMAGQGIINVLLVPFVKDILHGDAILFGWVASAQGIGGLAGTMLIGQFGKKLTSTQLVTGGLVADGVMLIVMVNSTWIPAVLVLTAAIGIGIVAVIVGYQTILQQRVIDEYRGRVFGVAGMTQSLTLLLGMLIASALAHAAGVVPLLDVASVVIALSGLSAVVALRTRATHL